MPTHPASTLVGGALSVQAISWVIEHSKHKGNSFVVLLMIANHARSDGTGAWPSVRTLARESRVSTRTVRYSFQDLKDSGELSIEKGRGPSGTNLYSLPKMGDAKSAPPAKTARPPAIAVAPEPSLEPSNTKNPPTPLSGGNTTCFQVGKETILVHMGRHKRLPNMESLMGAQADDYVAFLQSRGFGAEVLI